LQLLVDLECTHFGVQCSIQLHCTTQSTESKGGNNSEMGMTWSFQSWERWWDLLAKTFMSLCFCFMSELPTIEEKKLFVFQVFEVAPERAC
jgi:hypothetical protein